MEDRIQLLLDKFSCHDSTHPLLTKLWVEALKECKSKISIIEKTIEQGEELIEKIPNSVNDPDISTIITLFSILFDYENRGLDTEANANTDANANTN